MEAGWAQARGTCFSLSGERSSPCERSPVPGWHPAGKLKHAPQCAARKLSALSFQPLSGTKSSRRAKNIEGQVVPRALDSLIGLSRCAAEAIKDSGPLRRVRRQLHRDPADALGVQPV